MEYASKDFVYFASNSDYYYQRAVLESQAYYWANAYRKLYPNEMRVFFENDLYIVYLLEQNPYYLNNFQIDYLTAMK